MDDRTKAKFETQSLAKLSDLARQTLRFWETWKSDRNLYARRLAVKTASKAKLIIEERKSLGVARRVQLGPRTIRGIQLIEMLSSGRELLAETEVA
jgi:DNA-binding XRE family transcriptional regulator